LRYASAAAALACTRLGAQSSIPDAAEVAALLSEQPDNNTPARLTALRTLCGLN
jgi:ribokinase